MKAKIAILFVATSLVALLAFQVTAASACGAACEPPPPPSPSEGTFDGNNDNVINNNVINNNVINNNVINNNVINNDNDAFNRGGGKGGGGGGGRNCSRLDKPSHVQKCHQRR